jgi:SAM-dependent methyltransferase
MNDAQDAFGHALQDHLDGAEAFEVIERSDGLLDVSTPIGVYFNHYEDWGSLGQKAIDTARGRVLDIGCGAGRFALHLQNRGLDVVAIDRSPLAVSVTRRRGVKDARVLSITRITRRLGCFDTILMMGNNFGLFGSARRARTLLRRFRGITSNTGQIIAQVLDPSATTDPVHLAYQAANRARGRMPGQIRMRVRHRQYKTPWFDYLFVSLEELRTLIDGTGWTVSNILGWDGPVYVASLQTRRSRS